MGKSSQNHHIAGAMPEPWHIIVNGYFYTRQDPPFGGPEQPLDPLDRAKRMSDRRPWLDHWRNNHLPAYIQKLQHHREFNLSNTSNSQILDHLQDLYMDAGEFWYLLAPIGFGFEEFFFAPVYEHLTPESRPHLSDLFSGYGGKTLEAQIELESIATTASSDPSIATLFQNLPADQVLPALSDMPQGRLLSDLIKSYLNTYGCQLYSLDFFFPTLGEQPDITITNIRNYIQSSPSPVKEKLEAQVARRKQSTKWVLENATGSDQDRTMLRLLLDWHQTCADVRENATFYFQAGWPLIRHAVKELGRRFHEAGVLADTNDIYFLEQGEMTTIALELEKGGTLPGEVQASLNHRRVEWETRRKLAPPDRIPPPTDSIWESGLFSRVISGPDTDAHGRATLIGQGVSPGRIRGRARVIHSANEFNRIRKDDILVTTTTNPAWTPLFPLLSALVTETGGGATHCSLIAREYELPAVTGTGLATQVIRDGQIITVDGTMGVIELED
ncbi:PEP-utilizing enzyme [Dehalococcoidia bacterium]|nr:PEP-utilizing enzyme [Dehalococcoidia bacterium]